MKVDFHVHTSHSHDASDPPQKIIDQAMAVGLDGICITDHNTISGLDEAMEYASDKPILVIPGIEVHTRDGHILGINVKKKIERGLTFEETVKQIRDAGGIAVLAHPFFWPHHFKAWRRIDFVGVRNYIDGIEIANASAFRRANRKAAAFAQKFDIPVTSGSDAHSLHFVGKSFIEIEGGSLTCDEVVKVILSNHPANKIGGREMRIWEKINSATIMIGEKRKTKKLEQIRIKVGGKEAGLVSFLKSRVSRWQPKIRSWFK